MPNSIVQATRLRAEYQVNPVGLGGSAPRLSWWVTDPRPAARQTAYRIRAASSLDSLPSPDLWDSGKILSAAQTQITFAGPALVSRQRVWWDVELWDADGNAGPVSEPAWFEMGLLARSDWQARLISTPLEGTGQVGAPSPLLRKSFDLPSPPVAARLYITALGLYEASINGQPVGDHWLRPGWTDYHKRLNYQTYDVTAQLQAGPNTLGVVLGDGWYCGRVGALDRGMAWGARPSTCAQLEVTLPDGSTVRVSTDDSWTWHAGPILNSDLIHGEEYDARREIDGWDTSTFDDATWQRVTAAPVPDIILEPSLAPPVRALQERKAIAEPRAIRGGWERGALIYDFGQNLTGVLRLNVRGPAGRTLIIRHAEALKTDGTIDVSNLRSARAIDHYTLRGDPAGETFTPRFTLHGFRYAEISFTNVATDGHVGVPFGLTRESVTAIVLASDTPDTGTFECDHPLVNQLQSNIRWGMRGNLIEVPTDCPQRDERLGWTGDTHIFAPTAAFNADVAGFYQKWMRDVTDAQLDSGAVPAVVPKPGRQWDFDGEAGWTDATVAVPWAMFQAYGDRRVLEDSYATMRRWITYQTDTSRDGVRGYAGRNVHNGFGDWLALDGPGGPDPARTATPKDFIATAYFAESLKTIAKIARVLGHAADADAYAEHQRAVVAAFNREFVSPAGRLTAPSQTGHLMALAFDLLPEAHRPAAVAELVRLIEERGWHLTTGFLGTPLLCPVLTRFGRNDVAYRLLLQESYPGWLYPVTLGATTMWERWNSWHPATGFVDITMNSLNHYAYGAVGKWLYETVAGIDLVNDFPGYERVRFAPRPGNGLTRASAAIDSPRGPIRSSWQVDAGAFRLEISVPPNTSAEVVLPDGTVHSVAAGVHAFACAMAEAATLI